MIKCAIFDADGTLIDSMNMWKEITYRFAADNNIQVPADLHTTLNRLSMAQCADHYRGLGVPGTTEEVMESLSQYAIEGYRTLTNEKPGAREFLRLLRENGIHTAVATASNIKGVKAAMDHEGMLPYIEYFLSCQDIGKSKEHPDVFLRCAQEFSACAQESVVFEDSAYALETAKKAGFITVAIEDPISSENGGKQRLLSLADRYLEDFTPLIAELTPPEDDFAGELGAALNKK